MRQTSVLAHLVLDVDLRLCISRESETGVGEQASCQVSFDLLSTESSPPKKEQIRSPSEGGKSK